MEKKLLRQFFMLSKLIVWGIFLQCLFFSIMYAHSLEAQEIKNVGEVYIELELENPTLRALFNDIESKTDYKFTYYSGDIDLDQAIRVNKKNQSVRGVLLEVSKETGLSFRQVNNNINVKKAPDAKEKPKEIEVIIEGVVITGRVTSFEDQSGIPGVNILVKGTATGTLTDADGYYSLEVPDGSAVLIFSFLGYVTEEIEVGNRAVIDVELTPDITQLQEVIIVGYGTVQKRDLTGSVSKIKSEVIKEVPAVNVQDALAGRVSGALIRTANGDNPDGGSYIRIRGTNSLNDDANDPLYVIDGIPTFLTNLSAIDPNIIESVEVLKDASATAIYGSRASAGVVMITTKQGSQGPSNITFNMQYGIQNPLNTHEMMNGDEHYAKVMEGWSYDFTETELEGIPAYQAYFNPVVYDEEAQKNIYNFPWDEAFLREDAVWQKYALSFDGGNDKVKYFMSGSYEDRQGILIGSGFKRFALNTNINAKLNKYVDLGLSIIGSQSNTVKRVNDNGLWNKENSYMQTVLTPQWFPAYDQNGNFIDLPTDPRTEGDAPLRVATAWNKLWRSSVRDNNFGNKRFLSTLFLDIQPVKNLFIKPSLGIDFTGEESKEIKHMLPFELPVPLVRNKRKFEETTNWVFDVTATYKLDVKQHKADILAGFSMQENNKDFLELTLNGSRNDNLDQIGNMPEYLFDEDGNLINNVDAKGIPAQQRLESFFGRINYSYRHKYLATITFRRDGTSKFGPENQFGNFPSAAVGWNITEESFMKGASFINNLKLRASWGLTGNQASIKNFTFLSRVETGGSIFGLQSRTSNLGNPEIKWESIEQFNAGFDLDFFRSRIGIVFDYYNKISRDMLGKLPLNPASGYNQISGNLGSIRNRGVEFTLNTKNIITNNFEWSTDFNITFNQNKVLDLGTEGDGSKTDSLISDGGNHITVNGQPIGMFYVFEFDGIWQEDEAAEAALYGRVPGMIKNVDQNGDNIYNVNDRRIIGNPHPTYYGGINNTLRYKGFTLSFLFTYMGGHDLFHQARIFMESGHPDFNQSVAMRNSWTPENRSNVYPRMWNQSNNRRDVEWNSKYLENASFIKLSNVNFNYSFPAHLIKKVGLKGATLGFTGRNLLVFTNYTGLDPESEGNTNNALQNGVDNTPYPTAKTFLFNLSLNF